MYGIVMDRTSLSHMVGLSMAALMGMYIILILYISLVHDATNMITCSNMNMNKNTNKNTNENMDENVTRGFCTLLADIRPFPLNCCFACGIGCCL